MMDELADERSLLETMFSKRAKLVAAAAAAAAAAAKKAPAARSPPAAVPTAPAAPAAAVAPPAPAAALTPLQAVLAVCEHDDRLAPVGAALKVSDVLEPPTAMRALDVLQPIERDIRGLMNARYVRWVKADLLDVVLPALQRLTGQHDWPAAKDFYRTCENIDSARLHQAVADALLPCQPAEPSAGDVHVLLDALERCGAPPSDQQWGALCTAARRPSAAASLGAELVREVFGKAQMLTRAPGTSLSPGACTALQSLFEHLAVKN